MRKLLFITVLSLSVVLVSCGGGKDEDNSGNGNGNGGGNNNGNTFVAVTGITGVPAAYIIGTPLTLSGTVAPSNATNRTIAWSVNDAGTTGATISSNAFSATAAGTATVRATITNGATETTNYTQDFSIKVQRLEDIPAVTGVTVSPETVSVGKGYGQTFTATVTGNNLTEADKAVTWTVAGNKHRDTFFNAPGNLRIAYDETATSLTVRATSVFDKSKSGTATVTVTSPTNPAKIYIQKSSLGGTYNAITLWGSFNSFACPISTNDGLEVFYIDPEYYEFTILYYPSGCNSSSCMWSIRTGTYQITAGETYYLVIYGATIRDMYDWEIEAIEDK